MTKGQVLLWLEPLVISRQRELVWSPSLRLNRSIWFLMISSSLLDLMVSGMWCHLLKFAALLTSGRGMVTLERPALRLWSLRLEEDGKREMMRRDRAKPREELVSVMCHIWSMVAMISLASLLMLLSRLKRKWKKKLDNPRIKRMRRRVLMIRTVRIRRSERERIFF